MCVAPMHFRALSSQAGQSSPEADPFRKGITMTMVRCVFEEIGSVPACAGQEFFSHPTLA